MENKNQMKLIEVNGKSQKIDAKIYLPAGEMKEIIIACHGFAGDKESSAIEALADEMNRNNVGVICFDFPGHGKSEVDADKLTIAVEDGALSNLTVNVPVALSAMLKDVTDKTIAGIETPLAVITIFPVTFDILILPFE